MSLTKEAIDKYDVEFVTKWSPPEDGDLRALIAMPNIPKPCHGCLRGDAEVLTIDGWKRIDSVTTEDTVATWDRDTEKIIWDHPYETVKKYYKQMIRIKYEKYQTLGMLVSPDHRLPIRKQTDGRKQINGVRKLVGREWVLADTTAAKINLNAFQHFITAARNGTDKENQLTDLERIYISIQADGCFRQEYNGERLYRMAFKKDRKKIRFEELCTGAGVTMTKINHHENSHSASVNEQRYTVKVVPECKNFWNCFDITSFGKEKAQQFIDEISLWDGSCPETCGILNRRYVTTNLNNAKFAQAVAVIAGVTSSLQVRQPGNGEQKLTCYIIDFLDRDYRATQSCTKTVEEYDDYAYCINVPTSYFVVRDADSQSVMITGNCAPRTLLGAQTWNHMRRRAYAMANDTCEICGEKPENLRRRHGHEVYEIDYEKGTVKFVRVFCICSLCHLGGIHTGRALTLHKQGNPLYPKEALIEGAENAFKLAYEYNQDYPDADLRLYSTWLDYLKQDDLREDMEKLIEKYDMKFYAADPEKIADWKDWELIIGRNHYPTPYEDEKAWKEAMKKQGEKDTDRILQKRMDKIFSGELYDELNKILQGGTNEHENNK